MLLKYKKVICAIAAAGLIVTGAVQANNASKTDLRDLIMSETLDASAYTPITYQAYSSCLATAIAVSEELFTASDEIDEAYSNLQTSIAQLQLLPDKSTLQEAYNHAISLNQLEYIPQSVAALEHAISFSAEILNNPNATNDHVDQALTELESSLGKLILKPDKTELSSVLDIASEINAALYLPKSYTAVKTAIDHANGVLLNDNALETDVNSAVSQLQQAIEQLVERPDKTNLRGLIAQAKDIPEEKYTTVSYTALQKTITSATKVLNDENATQEQVSVTEASLQTSLNDLVVSTKGIYKINIRFSRESNNHVGNSWSYGASYNNSRIDGQTITASHGATISIFCKVVEEDSVPDVGSGYLSLRMENGAENSIRISVYENRGRYSGNRAVWIVTATATLIERV